MLKEAGIIPSINDSANGSKGLLTSIRLIASGFNK